MLQKHPERRGAYLERSATDLRLVRGVGKWRKGSSKRGFDGRSITSSADFSLRTRGTIIRCHAPVFG